MTFSLISDIHIKSPNDEAESLLLKFLNHKLVRDSDEIFLLGDVFDLMIGNFEQNFLKYNNIWNKIIEFCNNGKQVYYFEGNHDFHLEQFFNKYLVKNLVNEKMFSYVKDALIINRYSKFIYISHGDDIEIGNHGYKLYKSFIRSKFIELLANDVVSFEFIDLIGKKMSNASRENNKKYFDDKSNTIRTKFRESAKCCWNDFKVNFVVCGHSHVKDLFENELGQIYINNGYAMTSNSFIHMNDKEINFVQL